MSIAAPYHHGSLAAPAHAAPPPMPAAPAVVAVTQQQALIDEDLFAGRSVSLLFLAIVTMGTLLMLGTVLYTL